MPETTPKPRGVYNVRIIDTEARAAAASEKSDYAGCGTFAPRGAPSPRRGRDRY